MGTVKLSYPTSSENEPIEFCNFLNTPTSDFSSRCKLALPEKIHEISEKTGKTQSHRNSPLDEPLNSFSKANPCARFLAIRR